DLEMAFIENDGEVMDAIEGLMANIWNRVASEHQKELQVLGKQVPIPARPFRRITFDAAVKLLQQHKVALPRRAGVHARDDETWAYEIGNAEEKELGEILRKDGHDFFFITKFPLVEKPFYCMPEHEKMTDTWSRAFDLEYRGVELLSGAQRIHDAKLLEEGLVRKDLNPKDFEGYLRAFRYGMPPHGGCGIGVERILMQMLELPNIREAVIFPRDRTRLSP
ncbi:MAG: aspartate--tRNA(Asn) ligase, partial [Euryarchaeota archaeon]|nr:aspartate--tRNA(Asn) ligase [Euryarchaeota archaeon]